MTMLSYAVAFTVAGLDKEQLETLFREFGELLTEVEQTQAGLLDHAVSVDLGRRRFEFDLTTEAADAVAAERLAKHFVLSLLASTGGSPEGDGELGGRSQLIEQAAFQRGEFEVLNRELIHA